MEARRTAGLNNAPLCLWSPTPPLELKGAPAEALSANAGFVTIGTSKKLVTVFQIFFSHYNRCNGCLL